MDGTGSALMLIHATGSLPGTREREQLWRKAIEATPEWVHTEVLRWEDAALPGSTGANSVRIYKNAPPGDDTYDDAALVQILYPQESQILDIMDLRQHIAGFIAAEGQEFGNWKSKEGLRDRPLDLRREIKDIPVAHRGLDLAAIYRNHSDVQRFFVIGYDLFQVPVFRMEFIRAS